EGINIHPVWSGRTLSWFGQGLAKPHHTVAIPAFASKAGPTQGKQGALLRCRSLPRKRSRHAIRPNADVRRRPFHPAPPPPLAAVGRTAGNRATCQGRYGRSPLRPPPHN